MDEGRARAALSAITRGETLASKDCGRVDPITVTLRLPHTMMPTIASILFFARLDVDVRRASADSRSAAR